MGGMEQIGADADSVFSAWYDRKFADMKSADADRAVAMQLDASRAGLDQATALRLDATRADRIEQAKAQCLIEDDRPKLLAKLRATEEENARMHAELCALRKAASDRKPAEEIASRDLRETREHLADLRALIRLIGRDY